MKQVKKIRRIRDAKPNAKFPNKLSSFEFYNVKKLRKYLESPKFISTVPSSELVYIVLNLIPKAHAKDLKILRHRDLLLVDYVDAAQRFARNSSDKPEVELFYLACKLSGISLGGGVFKNFLKSLTSLTVQYNYSKLLVFLLEQLTKNKEKWKSTVLLSTQEEIENILHFFKEVFIKLGSIECRDPHPLFEDVLEFGWKNLETIKSTDSAKMEHIIFLTELYPFSIDDFKNFFEVTVYCSDYSNDDFPRYSHIQFMEYLVSSLVDKYLKSIEHQDIGALGAIPKMIVNIMKFGLDFYVCFEDLTKPQFDTLFQELAKINPNFVHELGKRLFEDVA